MANLTVSIDDDVLRRARQRAAANGTSVNQLVREFLEQYAGGSDSSARNRILTFSDAAQSSSGDAGRTWNRDELARH